MGPASPRSTMERKPSPVPRDSQHPLPSVELPIAGLAEKISKLAHLSESGAKALAQLLEAECGRLTTQRLRQLEQDVVEAAQKVRDLEARNLQLEASAIMRWHLQ